MSIQQLNIAKENKMDEFYTLRSEIDTELQYYEENFNDKIVLCPCNDGITSNFFKYFKDNFDKLKLKLLISTTYNKNGNGIKYIFDGSILEEHELNNNGSFQENGDLFEQADIVCTNPPFSMFRNFFDTLVLYNNKFLIIGSLLACTYNNAFNYVKLNKARHGVNHSLIGNCGGFLYEFGGSDNIIKKT